MKYQKEKLGKIIPFSIAKRKKVPRNKLNQGDKRPVLRKLQNTEERNEGRYKKWKHVPCS